MRTLAEITTELLSLSSLQCRAHSDVGHDVQTCVGCGALEKVRAEARAALKIAQQETIWRAEYYEEKRWKDYRARNTSRMAVRKAYDELVALPARIRCNNPCRLAKVTTITVTETIEQEGEVTP